MQCFKMCLCICITCYITKFRIGLFQEKRHQGGWNGNQLKFGGWGFREYKCVVWGYFTTYNCVWLGLIINCNCVAGGTVNYNHTDLKHPPVTCGKYENWRVWHYRGRMRTCRNANTRYFHNVILYQYRQKWRGTWTLKM